MDIHGARGHHAHGEEREAGAVVYPVVARRSGGLSLGVNLFPEAKRCSFDCPYCEVFPPRGGAPFSMEALRGGLAGFARLAADGAPGLPGPVRDLSLSGNGEPTLSPFLGEALEACAEARRAWPDLLGGARLVLITNSTGFLDARVSSLLSGFVRAEGLEVWAKLDAGTEEAFAAMSGSRYRLADVAGGIEAFARGNPVIVQSMACRLDGAPPGPEELAARAGLLRGMLDRGALLRELHVYTMARPSPMTRCAPLTDGELGELGAGFRRALGGLKVRLFGEEGELP